VQGNISITGINWRAVHTCSNFHHKDLILYITTSGHIQFSKYIPTPYALMIFLFGFLFGFGPGALPPGMAPPICPIISFSRSSLIPPPVTAGLCSGRISLSFHPRGTAGGGGGSSGIGIPRMGSLSGVSGVVGCARKYDAIWM
jgi:hypothetical protein